MNEVNEWEKFVKVWTNFRNLIENFEIFKENFNKNLEKFNENLKFFTIDSHSLSSKKFVLGERSPGPPPLEPLLMSLQKFGGGREAGA